MNTHLTEFEIQELCEMNDSILREHPHLSFCTACREKVRFAKGLADILNDMEEEPIDELFAEAVIERISSTEAEFLETAKKGKKSWAHFIGTVICLVVMWLFLRPHIHDFIVSDRPYEVQLIFISIFTVSLFALSELLSLRINGDKGTISFSF